MFEGEEPVQEKASDSSKVDPFLLALGLLRADRWFLIPIGALLSISTVVQMLFPPKSLSEVASLVAIDRLFQLIVLSLITLRWRGLLSARGEARGNPWAIGFRILAMGYLMWGVVTLPALGAAAASGPIGIFPSFVLFVFAAVWSLRYFFYFGAFGLLGVSWGAGLRSMGRIYERAPSAAIRSLIAPIAITALVVSIFSSFSPDGRSSFWSSASSVAEGFFWILSIYTGLGYALVLIDDHEWRTAGLDPYRNDRLLTLQAQGRFLRCNPLSPSAGVKILCLALLVAVANISQALHLSPAAKVEVVSVDPREHGISVIIRAHDTATRLRGFNPMAFSVASQTGYPISSELIRISFYPGGEEFRGFLPDASDTVSLTLDFRSNKTQEVLRSMDNMWLWYNLQPLVAIRPELLSAPKLEAVR